MELFGTTLEKRLTAAFALVFEQKAERAVNPNVLTPPNMVGRPIRSTWNTDRAIREGYKASTWVYACITRIMKSAASVPWIAERKIDFDTWERAEDHSLNKLTTRPNPYTSWQNMVEMMTALLYLGGNALLLKNQVRGITDELWMIHPTKIKPVPGKTKFIEYYEFKNGGKTYKIDPELIIHIQFVDPANPYWGISPLMAGSTVVDTEVAAVRWNYESLQHRAVPDGALVFKQALSKDQYDNARQIVREQMDLGGHYPWVLGSDADWKQMSMNAVEMDYLGSRKLTREEICGIFGTPPPIVGIYDKATLANIETARKIFWLDTVIPYLNDVVNAINFGLELEYDSQYRLAYDIRNVEALQAIFKEKVDTGHKLFQMGVPFNTINQRVNLGFDPIPGGDVGYIPSNMFPTTALDGDAETGEPPTPPEPEPEDEEDIEGEED